MEVLIKKFMAGTTSRHEEMQLRELLQQKPQRTAEENALLLLLQDEVSLLEGQEAWLQEDESALFDRLMQEHTQFSVGEDSLTAQPQLMQPSTPPKRFAQWTLWVGMSALAALFCGMFFLHRAFLSELPTDETVTYIYGNKVEDPDMAIDMMQNTLGELFAQNDIEDTMSEIFK